MLRSLLVSQRFQSKDIPNSQQNHCHKCYFHNTNNISKFCINKKCTLPLCEKCIPIHVKQHSKEQKTLGKQNILLYSDAHKIALQQLSSIVNKKQQTMHKFQQITKNIRKEIEQVIDRQFSEVEKHISTQVNQIKMLAQKQNKIKKGSLKTLIFYFADEQGFKIKTQKTNQNLTFNFADQIIKLKQKLNQQLKKIEAINIASQSNSFSQRHTNQAQISSLKDLSSIKKKQQKQTKFQTSTDFAQILKDQKNRLQNVKNKNLMFATNYGQLNGDDNIRKYGSKSVDNFYSNKIESSSGKDSKQNRPLQFGTKTSSQGFFMKQQNLQDCLNNQQRIDKIRKKYVGDNSLSKQKKEYTEKFQREPLGTMKMNNFMSQKYDNKQITLSDRLLSREEIRLDIQNRLQQKVNKHDLKIRKQSLPQFSLKQGTHQTFRKPQKVSQNTLINKQQEFTLNKNYGFNDTQKIVSDKEKILMSSIKKQLQAVPTDQSRPKQARFKNFLQGNDRQKLSSFDVRQEKNFNFSQLEKKQQITDFVVTQLEESKEANFTKHQFSKKKEQFYDDTKQRIRLSEPTLIKTDQMLGKNQQQQQKSQTISKALSIQKSSKQGRRFNYLYDSGDMSENFTKIL